jgi:hypothetical protein
MDIIQRTKKIAIEEIEKYGLPSLLHFEIWEQKALEFAKKFNADTTIVQLGIYLMDIKLWQAFAENRITEHTQMSTKYAKIVLDWYNLSDIYINRILNCVEAHHGKVPYTCLEAEICANADCYRFISPKGFLSYLTTLGKRHNSFTTCLDNVEKKLDEKYAILSLQLCKQELKPYYTTLKKYIQLSR